MGFPALVTSKFNNGNLMTKKFSGGVPIINSFQINRPFLNQDVTVVFQAFCGFRRLEVVLRREVMFY